VLDWERRGGLQNDAELVVVEREGHEGV
jgi:hypothetical protein